MSDKKGFTLIELIVVMVIIGALAAISVTIYSTMVVQGSAKAAQNNLIAIYNAQKSYYFANGVYCTASTGAVSPCGDNVTDLNSNLATLNQPNPTITSLNINDNNFTYACTNTGGFTCTATNVSNANLYLTLINNPIVLPGGTPPLNPSCSSTNHPAYCPS